MTKEERARRYHKKIISNNPAAEAWDFTNAHLAGAMEQERSDKWRARKAFCISQCGPRCPQFSENDIDPGSTVVHCPDLQRFAETYNSLSGDEI